MSRQYDDPARYPAASLSDMIHATLDAVHLHMPKGQQQSPQTTKVRNGEHACPKLEKVIVDMRRAGVSYEDARAVALQPLRFLDRVYARITDHRDVRAASIVETRAQSAVDVFQVEASDTSAVTEAQIEAALPKMYWAAEAALNHALCWENELLRRRDEREKTRRLIGVA